MSPCPQPALLARSLLTLCSLGLTLGAVRAETSPYYIGLSESITHDSNLYRLGDGRPTPSTIQSRGDTSFATALVGGVDQQWGRQRLTGSLNLAHNRPFPAQQPAQLRQPRPRCGAGLGHGQQPVGQPQRVHPQHAAPL